MKKIYAVFLLFSLLIAGTSCEDELDRLWQNPNKLNPKPEEVVSGLFTQMQKTRFWQKDYGEWYHTLNDRGSFVQIIQLATHWPYSAAWIETWADFEYGDVNKAVGTANSNQPARFERFYKELTNYALVRDEVAALSGQDYDDNLPILYLATVLKNVVGLQTVDLFNSIPYFNAFKGSEGIFFAGYDDPLEIYKSVIEEYAAIAADLKAAHAKMSPVARSVFSTQDLFFRGDIDKWVCYVNAECLKACVRISGVAEDFVKPVIATVIKQLQSEDYVFDYVVKSQCRIGTSGNGGTWQRGLYERFYRLCIPDILIMNMNHGDITYDINEDDPRLPAIGLGYWHPEVDGVTDRVEYFGVSGDWELNRYYRNLPADVPPSQKGRRWNVTPQWPDAAASYVMYPSYNMDIMVKTMPWTMYNPATFTLNETPAYVMSRAEVDLLLAEVALKGLATTGKTAGDHIRDAVVHSVDFWYMMNARPDYTNTDMSAMAKSIVHPEKPSSAVVSAYAARIQQQFNAAGDQEEKMDVLMVQKYIHLNILQPYELFAELRRTRHPRLDPITVKASSRELINATMMFERFRLPASEQSNNFEEYSKVAADDKYDRPIFWVPASKINEKHFRAQALRAWPE